MIRPLSLLAATLLFGACASSQVTRPDSGTASSSSTAPRAALPSEAPPIDDYEFHVRVELLGDGQFRRTVTERYTLRTATPPAILTHVAAEFDPDEDDPPLLTATVTLPDGTVKTMDPATVTETPAEGASEGTSPHRRRRVAPLPALIPGARIESQTVTHRARPRLTVGHTFSHPLALPFPTKATSFVLDQPATQALHTRVLETELTPERIERDGRVITTWRRSDVPAFNLDWTLPPEERRFPQVMVSTASGWSEVARAYHAAVAPRLTSKALTGVARGLEPVSSSPRDVAAAALEWMHHHLRDTGVDFESGSILPSTPAETLKRGAGDAKDLAAFLVALLERRGVPAQMVLVQSDDRSDAADELAGLNRFTHAVVKVPGDTPLWIDPTLRGMPVGTLAPLSMARIALVVDPSTTSLSRTPVGSAADNRAILHTEITLPPYGKGTVKVVKTLTGTALGWSRSRAQHQSPEQLNAAWAESVAAIHGTESFTYRHSDPLSALAPFEETLEIRGTKTALAADRDAVANLGFGEVLDFIPESLQETPNAERAGEAISGPIFVGAPQTLEMVTRVRVSPLFELVGGPVSRDGAVGALRWSYKIKPLTDGAEARMTVTFDDRVIPADQVQKVRDSIQELFESDSALEFANRPMRLMEDGKLTEAVRALRNLEREAPDDAVIRSLLARAAVAAGLTREAQTLAREARDLGPLQPSVARTVGWILSLSPDGIEYGAGMPRSEALDALRTARRLEPEELAGREIELQLLARNEEGRLGGKGSDLDTALELVRRIPPDQVDQEMGDLHALLLFEAGHDRRLLETKDLPDSDAVRMLRLAARARAHGPKAALTWLSRQARGGNNDQVLAGAAFMLFKARAYPESHALSKRVRDPGAAQFASLIGTAVRRDAAPFDPANPADVIIEAIAHALRVPSRADVKTLNLQDAWVETMRGELSATFQALQGADVAMLDTLHGSATTQVVDLPGVGVLATYTNGFGGDLHLLERKGNGYRFHPLFKHERQEAAAWEALGKGELETVRSWLKVWFAMLEKKQNFVAPPGIRELSSGDRADLTLALSVLAPPPAEARSALERSIRGLEQAWKTRDPKDLRSRHLSRHYVMALSRAGRHDAALAANTTAHQEGLYDQDGQAFFDRMTILRHAKRDEALAREGRELMARPETRMVGYLMQLTSAQLRMDAKTYRDLHLEMAAANLQRLESLNNAAWSALFLGRIEDADVQRAEQALGPETHRKGSLDTLAVLLAQRGEVDRAVVTLNHLRGNSLEPETAPSVRYARARIAEELGFTRAAKAIYSGIPAGKDFNNMALLAKQRLEVLTKPRRAPATSPR